MDNDEKKLREWMQANIGGLKDDRSAASYALEFLMTSKANAEINHAEWLMTLDANEISQRLKSRSTELKTKIDSAIKLLDGSICVR